MIVVELVGGLGNQIFQYAAARAVALRCGAPLALDVRRLRGHASRQYALDAFAISANTVDEASLPPIGGNLWRRLSAGLKVRSRWTEFKERQLAFDPGVLQLPDGTYLRGYFQSELYFADQEEALRRELVFVRPLEAANAALLEEIAGSLSVSLHIRRGDYVTDAGAARVHGAIDLGFYRRAAKLIADRVGGVPTFFVFSDDPDWVADNLDLPFPFRLVSHNGPERGAEDLRLMAACRHHIIANSSFSWWGAWLNSSQRKIVVAPRQWFRDPSLDDSAILPVGWIRLA